MESAISFTLKYLDYQQHTMQGGSWINNMLRHTGHPHTVKTLRHLLDRWEPRDQTEGQFLHSF